MPLSFNMRLLILSALSTVVCTVYASPIYYDDVVYISRREPGFFSNVFHIGPACKTTKGSVSDILGHLTNQTTGTKSDVWYYDVSGGFGGQPAVVKKSVASTQHTKEEKKALEEEIGNLCQVDQFLNWGVQKGKGKEDDTYYVVMRKMGESAKKTGLDDTALKKLQKDAISRYHTKYHIDITNPIEENFAYNSTGGKWEAEVIRWEKAKLDKGARLPVVPSPQKI